MFGEVEEANIENQLKAVWMSLEGRAVTLLDLNKHPETKIHMMVRYKNQLLVIRASDKELPRAQGLVDFSRSLNAIPCYAISKYNSVTMSFRKEEVILLNADTGKTLDLDSMNFETPYLMTEWEIHQVGVEIVANDLIKKGFTDVSKHTLYSNACQVLGSREDVDLAVIVRTLAFPYTKEAYIPDRSLEFRKRLDPEIQLAMITVQIANADQVFHSKVILPLYRGDEIVYTLSGFEEFGSKKK